MIEPQKILGIIGLILIIVGVLVKSKSRDIRDILYIFGGAFLLLYSVYIKEIVFIILQAVFILVAVYDIIKLKLTSSKNKNTKTKKVL